MQVSCCGYPWALAFVHSRSIPLGATPGARRTRNLSVPFTSAKWGSGPKWHTGLRFTFCTEDNFINEVLQNSFMQSKYSPEPPNKSRIRHSTYTFRLQDVQGPLLIVWWIPDTAVDFAKDILSKSLPKADYHVSFPLTGLISELILPCNEGFWE